MKKCKSYVIINLSDSVWQIKKIGEKFWKQRIKLLSL